MASVDRILIVDDDIDLLKGLVRQLGERFDLITATDGPAALAMVKEQGPFAAVLCDMRMPGMDGVEVLRRFAELAPDTVRLMLTGNADQGTAVAAINEGGVFRFLSKPVTRQVLAETLDAAIDQYRVNIAEAERKTVSVESQRLAAAMFEATNEAISVTDLDGNILAVNNAFTRITGYRREDVIGQNARILKSGQHSPAFYLEMWRALVHEGAWQGEIVNRRKSGEVFPEWLNIKCVKDEDGNRQKYIAVFNDISEIKAAQKTVFNLSLQKEQADSANEAKTLFLAKMSHEIRTPLNAVLGVANRMLRRAKAKVDRDDLEHIMLSGHHLLGVINDILDISKISTGKLELHAENFDLRCAIRSVVSIVEPLAAQKHLTLTCEIDQAFPGMVFGDQVRIKQCLMNYLSNAVKFTDRGSVVLRANTLRNDPDGIRLRFVVEDTGMGISEADAERLFTDFEQVDNSRTRSFGGTGLGLAITRRLAKMMGGDTGFDSRAGEGSRFWFEVLLVAAEDQGSTGTATELLSSAEVEKQLLDEHGSARILLAEDNRINQELILGMLADVGLQAQVAINGLRAVQAAGNGPFDLILMDMQMPIMDGLEATQAIRKSACNEAVPIIALTANVFVEDRNKCFAAGMNDFLPKPVDPDTFYRMLLKWLPHNVQEAKPQLKSEAVDNQTEQLERHLGEIPWVDLGRGMSYCRKVGRYIQGLKDYAGEYGNFMAEVRKALADNNRHEARRLAHSMKGSSAMLGITGIQEPAAELEQAILSEGEVEPLIALVEQRYAIVAQAIQTMVSKEASR